MGGAHLVNPYDIEAISQAIHHIIDSRAEEKQERMEQSLAYTHRHSTIRWAQKFLNDLKRADDNIGYQYEKVGLGLDWQIIKFKQGFKELNASILEDSFVCSKKRLIVIDQEGVIPMKVRNGISEPT